MVLKSLKTLLRLVLYFFICLTRRRVLIIFLFELQIELAKAPLLWELGNNATRPLVYFMTNPAVWDGLRNLCCRKKHQLVNDDEVDEVEQPLAPVTTV